MSVTDTLYGENDKPKVNDGGFHGVAIGVVTDINDPKKQGRIKVKIVNSDSSDHETDFIGMMAPLAGTPCGSFSLPAVGDEVLVAFLRGDINCPYVLGALWNKEHMPSVKVEEQKTSKQLSIKLDDQVETVVVQDKDGRDLLEIDAQNGLITVQANKKMVLKSGKSSVTLDAQTGGLQIESSPSINIKSQHIGIRAEASLELQAGGSLTVKCDGMATIKGAMVKIN